MRRAVEFFDGTVIRRGRVSVAYAADLALREGEGKATASQAWTQPPGTPSVGMALLRAYEYTEKRICSRRRERPPMPW